MRKPDIGLSMTTLVLMDDQTYKFLDWLDDNEIQLDRYNLTSIGQTQFVINKLVECQRNLTNYSKSSLHDRSKTHQSKPNLNTNIECI